VLITCSLAKVSLVQMCMCLLMSSSKVVCSLKPLVLLKGVEVLEDAVEWRKLKEGKALLHKACLPKMKRI